MSGVGMISQQPDGTMAHSDSNQRGQQARHTLETPPTITTRFFYASPIPIDDPLSPLPPPNPDPNSPAREPPKPFSAYDNAALDKAWYELRLKILKYNEEQSEKESVRENSRARTDSISRARRGSGSMHSTPKVKPLRPQASNLSQVNYYDDEDVDQELEPLESAPTTSDHQLPTTTGTPFIRAPSRTKVNTIPQVRDTRPSRPKVKAYDTYLWEDPSHLVEHSPAPRQGKTSGPTDKVAVGISRLHQVEMPDLKMTPIYWTPVNDTAQVIRGTWFYKDNMLPVETSVAIMLEAGYIELQVWTQTWKDELNSAIEVGAAGEMKIVHKLWPDTAVKKPSSVQGISRPSTAARETTLRPTTTGLTETGDETPESKRLQAVETASDLIEVSTASASQAAGKNSWGQQGTERTYAHCGVIYVDQNEARILKPNLLPSTYYGRRPLANYIRKGRALGINVVRGFDQAIWDRLHPTKSSLKTRQAADGVATSASGVPTDHRRKHDPDLRHAERPEVTDLVLVVHGIGQQLSKRMFNFHFTHAISSFRREINVEVGSKECKAHFRKGMGSIMALPVNWRHDLSFEDGGYEDEDNPARNDYNLADITPDGLTYVRNIVSDVMLDVPYYLSHHQNKMLAAVVREANRVYRLWCLNNPGFAENGRVHVIAHSLGSIMAVEILSKQPTRLPSTLRDPTSLSSEEVADFDHFLFDTHNLFLAGSPASFFLLLKQTQLLPRIDSRSAAAREDPSALTPDIAGEQGQYGCIAVENVYNLINGYDPVATCMNATVDATYASLLKKAWAPSAASGWFGAGVWGGSTSSTPATAPKIARLPSQVELETHNFTREEIAEKRMRLLNDNLQIDYFLRYGGGPLDIQYISMLSAHSSYWLLKDFTRMIVVEVGRREGQAGTLTNMRAVKGKSVKQTSGQTINGVGGP